MEHDFHDDTSDVLDALLEQHRAHAIILLDPLGRVVDWLAGAERIFGWSVDEIQGQMLERLFTPEDRARGVPRQELRIAETTGDAPDDRWQLRKNGSRVWVEGVLTALRNRAGNITGYAKIVRNRTESRGELELLQNRILALQEADERRRAFLATLIHELRGPLGVINHAREVLLHRARSPETDAALEIVERQVGMLDRIVEDLTELMRIGRGKLELTRRRVDLNESVRLAIETCREQTDERRQHLGALVPATPTFASVDPDRIQQILVNLLTNASKYTPVEGHIWVQLSVEAHDAVMRVKDDGMGIPSDMQARIFDLFTQVPSGRAMAGGGLGLGLPLVRELVQLHGGNVQVHSEGENRGSEFVVKLPLGPQ